jgi:hypothetical protein
MPLFAQVVNGSASILQRKLAAPESVYVKEAEVAFVGFAGEDVIVGAGLAARAAQATQPLTTRTLSSAVGFSSLALLVVLCELRANIGSLSSLRDWSCVRGIDAVSAQRGGGRQQQPPTLHRDGVVL